MATTSQSTALLDIRARLKAELVDQRERIAPPSGNRISTEGKQFKLPDGTVLRGNLGKTGTDGPLTCIILDWRITHMYRPGMYDAKKHEIPSCWAISRTLDCAPDPSKVTSAKHESCDGCPFNEFGSAMNQKGKACKEGRRLAVIPADATEETIPWILELPPTSIRGFEAYVTRLNGLGQHPMEIITEVGFADSAYPVPVFVPQTQASDATLAVAYALSQAPITSAALDREPG